jgi:hypothetical protein
VPELLHGAEVIFAPSEELKAQLKQASPELRRVVAPGRSSNRPAAFGHLRLELLDITAMTHAAAGSPERRQKKKEVGVCQAP